MAEPVEIESVVLACKRAGTGTFTTGYPYGFLVFKADESRRMSGFNTTHASRHVAQLATELKAEQLPAATAINGITVLPIEKGANSPWRDRVSLGRARNTDLTVVHQSVSKLHAHLTLVDRDAVDLVDQTSTNGVFVNGKRIDANTPVRLRDGDAVAFGEVAAKYHTTAGFLHFIEGLL